MSVEAAKELISKLGSEIKEEELGEPYFNSQDIDVFPFEKENFHGIIKPDAPSNHRLAFVDGGNLEIVGAPNFSIQLNRIYGMVWKNNDRVGMNLPRVEFFSAIFSDFEKGELHYETILVPTSPEFSPYLPDGIDLSFSSKERTLMFGMRADIQLMAASARNFAEWRYATLLAGILDKDDILIMDGSLQTSYKNEAKYLRALLSSVTERGIGLCGLSKTSSLHTTTGISLLGAVSKLASDSKIPGEWYYPIAQSSKTGLFSLISKFHGVSERVFRVDIPKPQYEKMGEDGLATMLGELAHNAGDPTFLGYPYGLIDADLLSRVSENELEYYRAIIYSEISGQNKQAKFLPHIRAGDAHDILNMIAGF